MANSYLIPHIPRQFLTIPRYVEMLFVILPDHFDLGMQQCIEEWQLAIITIIKKNLMKIAVVFRLINKAI